MVKNIFIKGVEYTGTFNANKELSQPVPGLEDSVLINWPRHHVCNNGIAVIEIDGGTLIRLGNHFLNESEKQMAKDYRGGLGSGTGTVRGPSKKDIDMSNFVKAVLAIKDINKMLSKESIELAKTFIVEDPAVISAVKTLVALGYSEEEAHKIAKAKLGK